MEALPPLSASKRRRLFVETKSPWTACFQSGIDGSDPTPAMSVLAQQIGVIAMRVCSTHNKAKWPAAIWEVYAPPSLGGDPTSGYRRSVCAANDGGRWVFHQSGLPYPFEDISAYKAARKKDRFTHQLLERYLLEFGLTPFDDNFYVVNTKQPGIVLERPPWKNEPRAFTLADAVAGKPWHSA